MILRLLAFAALLIPFLAHGADPCARAVEAVAAAAAGEGIALPPGSLDIPLVCKQTEYECGAATLLSGGKYLANHQGTTAALNHLMQVDPAIGTTHASLIRGARSMGLDAHVRFGMTEADLQGILDERQVVILEIQGQRSAPGVAWKDEWDNGHYVTLVGMDARNVYLMDPEKGRYAYIPREEFLERWHNFDDEWHPQQRGGIVLSGGKPVARQPEAAVRRAAAF